MPPSLLTGEVLADDDAHWPDHALMIDNWPQSITEIAVRLRASRVQTPDEPALMVAVTGPGTGLVCIRGLGGGEPAAKSLVNIVVGADDREAKRRPAGRRWA